MSRDISQRIDQEQRLQQRLSRQQVRYVRMLEMSEAEATQDVEREVEENPALEMRDSDSTPATSAEAQTGVAPIGSTRRTEFHSPAAGSESLYEHLQRQLGTLTLSPAVERVARYIIGNLDSNGYLRRNPESVADDIYVSGHAEPTAQELAAGLEAVRSLEPAGVGASDLRESLMLQLQRMHPSSTRDDALTIVSDYFHLLTSRRFSAIESRLGNDASRTANALGLVRRLNPKPGATFGSDSLDRANYIEPDFIINIDNDDITISMGGSVPEVGISASFEQAVADMERRRRRGRDPYVMARYNDAREYVRLLQRRQATLMDVMAAIADLQRAYLLSRGDESLLRPMNLRDVAERSGTDISVVSRATKNKYASLPWATVPLRFFFSEGFSATGGAGSGNEANEEGVVSGRGLELAIRTAVEQEDKRHPLSDDALRMMLIAQGFNVSRRTVSKYRDRLGIPVARLRAER